MSNSQLFNWPSNSTITLSYLSLQLMQNFITHQHSGTAHRTKPSSTPVWESQIPYLSGSILILSSNICLGNQVVSASEIQNPSSCLCVLFLPHHIYFTLHTPYIRRYMSRNTKITCLNSFRVRFILSLLQVQLFQLYQSKVKQYHLLKLNP